MGYGYIRERPTPAAPMSKPQIISFADVTLVLLVILMLSVTSTVNMAKVELPQAKHPQVRDINLAVTISLAPGKNAGANPGWRYYFEDDTTGIESKNLWTALRTIKGDADWPLALVRADNNAPGDELTTLIQCLQGLGVGEIAFVLKSEEDKAAERKTAKPEGS